MLGMGTPGALWLPRGAGEGQQAHAVLQMNGRERRFTVLQVPAGLGGSFPVWDKQGHGRDRVVPGAWRCPVPVPSPG